MKYRTTTILKPVVQGNGAVRFTFQSKDIDDFKKALEELTAEDPA